MIGNLFKSIKKTILLDDNLPQDIIIQKVRTITGQTIEKKYLKHKLIGSGAFACCYITQNIQTKKLYATKIVAKQNRNRVKMLNQLVIHKLLHHQNIVDFSHAFQDDHDIYIFLELCQNNTLQHLLKKKGILSTVEAKKLLFQIIQGLIYIHSKGIIHRDLKPRNIFLGNQNTVKIGDFGLAAKLQFQGEKKRNVCGTPQYMAPQMIQGWGYGKQVDIWSVGVLLYEMYTGKTPFLDTNNQKIMDHICDLNYKINQKGIPKQALSLIKRILIKNPQLRPSFEQILQSSFFKDQEIDFIKTMVSPRKTNTFNINFQTPRNTGRTTNRFPSANNNLFSSPKITKKNNNFLPTYVKQLQEIDNDIIIYHMSDNSYGLLKKDIQVIHQNVNICHIIFNKDGTKKIQTNTNSIDKQLKQILQYVKQVYQENNPEDIQNPQDNHQKKNKSITYLYKVTKHKDILMLKLSNNIMQMKFSDNTNILINLTHKYNPVIFIDNNKKITQVTPQDIIQDQKDRWEGNSQEKMKYVKKVIISLGIEPQKRTLQNITETNIKIKSPTNKYSNFTQLNKIN